MEKDKRNIANTMEIDSIIREAKSSPDAQPVNGVDTKNSTANNAPASARYQSPSADVSDSFVIYDDYAGGSTEKKTKGGKKTSSKGKKAAILTSVIIGVVAVIGVACFCLYNVFADFTYASNIYVNDIAIGGLSEGEARDLLNKEEQKLAQNINIQVKADQKTVVLTKDDFDYSFDTEDVLSKAYDYTKNTTIKTGEQRFNITMSLSEQSCKSAAEKVAKESNQKAQEASITDFDSSKSGIDRFKISESKNGVEIKTDELASQLQEFVRDGRVSGAVDAKTDVIEPSYSSQYIRKNLKKLSSFTTTSTNSANGNANMERALNQCNGSIIQPGEVWSFNGCTGNSNLESNGYKPAGVIVNGKHVTGVGGGICQSSTTIYNAAVMAGMEIVERSCHYYKSTYVDAGRDATVDYGNLDLRLKNIFDYQLVMECYMDGVVLHCNMYGLPNPEFDEIKISSSVSSYFSNGFKATAARTYYKDGKAVKTEAMPNSTYYTSAPGDSSSSKPSSQKPSSSKAESKPESTPDPEPTPDPNPDPTPDPNPDPEPNPTPDPEPPASNPDSGESQQ